MPLRFPPYISPVILVSNTAVNPTGEHLPQNILNPHRVVFIRDTADLDAVQIMQAIYRRVMTQPMEPGLPQRFHNLVANLKQFRRESERVHKILSCLSPRAVRASENQKRRTNGPAPAIPLSLSQRLGGLPGLGFPLPCETIASPWSYPAVRHGPWRTVRRCCLRPRHHRRYHAIALV